MGGLAGSSGDRPAPDDDPCVPLNPTRPWWRRLADNLGPVAPTDDDGWVPLNRGRWDDGDPDPDA